MSSLNFDDFNKKMKEAFQEDAPIHPNPKKFVLYTRNYAIEEFYLGVKRDELRVDISLRTVPYDCMIYDEEHGHEIGINHEKLLTWIKARGNITFDLPHFDEFAEDSAEYEIECDKCKSQIEWVIRDPYKDVEDR